MVVAPPIIYGLVTEVEKEPVVAPERAPDIASVVAPEIAPLDMVSPLIVLDVEIVVMPDKAPEMVSPDEPCINPITLRGLLRLNLSLSLSH